MLIKEYERELSSQKPIYRGRAHQRRPQGERDLNLALKGGCDKKMNAHVHICEGDPFFKTLLCTRYTQDTI